MKYIIKYLAPFCLILMLSILAVAQSSASEPLVIVVHGIGEGNQEDGWSRQSARTWKVETHEVTFRYEGRTQPTSYLDFSKRAGDWALAVQSQIKAIVSKNPGRRVIIVSHSWGTVVTKMALAGGVGGGRSDKLAAESYYVSPIDLGGVEIEKLVTLASPLGRADNPEVAFNLRQLHVDVPAGRPNIVKDWTNVFDIDDPVSNQSHNLPGATNVPVKGSGHSWDITGLSAHTGIWTNPMVSKYIGNEALRISKMPPLRKGVAAAPPAGTVRFFVRDNTTMKPLANAQVIVYGAINSPSEKFRESGTTNAAGTVDIPGIVLGVYTVTAHHASCPSFESGLTNIKPGETQGIPMVCGQPAVPTTSTRQPKTPSTSGSPEAIDGKKVCAAYMQAISKDAESRDNAVDGKHWMVFTRPWTYENGHCVGAHQLWQKKPEWDKPLAIYIYADAENPGRIPVGELKNYWQKKYPGLDW